MEAYEEIFRWVDADPTLARVASAARKIDKLSAAGRPTVRIGILRNITLEPALPAAIAVRCARAGLKAEIYLGGFDNMQQDIFDPASPLLAFSPDIVVVALRLHTFAPALATQFAALSEAAVKETISGALDRLRTLLPALRERTTATLLVHNFELAPSPAYGILDAQKDFGQQNAIRHLNLELRALVAGIRGAYVIDVDHLLSRVGYDQGLDNRYWHIGRAPYTLPLAQRLAAEYAKFAVAVKGKQRKCLVLDCDNTLWGGVVGEDGLEGIRLGTTHPGSAYMEFQAAILDLHHRGVLLALNTKNNPADVMEVLETHPSMLLRPDHLVAKRINWTDKATNLREIAAELNIGLDSLVFVDDNPFECDYVREQLPEVLTVQLPEDPTKYAGLLRDLGCFDTLTLSEEDLRRTAMYQAESKRAELRGGASSLEDYLRSLDMVLTFTSGGAFNIPRIAQLTQKTNQFNVTTRRYAEGDIDRMASDPAWEVTSARLRDKFDDSGIIAAMLVEYRDDEACIDTFLMSCRVIGRGVEQAAIARLAASARARGANRLVGEYLPTAKNGLAAGLFSDSGFSPVEGDATRWVLDLTGDLPMPPDWFQSIDLKEE